MAFYHCLFFLILQVSPLYAVKCYTGEYDSFVTNRQISDCSGNYCSRETVTINNHQQPNDMYMCGKDGGINRDFCTSNYGSRVSPYGQDGGTVDKMCCSGDLCNSSAFMGPLFAVIASFVALFLNKMI